MTSRTKRDRDARTSGDVIWPAFDKRQVTLANWFTETIFGYAAHLQARMSHLSSSLESEGLICAVSKVNIPPQSEILYEDWTEHYQEESWLGL